LAINHQIPIVPLVFLDNKKRYPFTFFSGSPGRMRAIGFSFILTEGLLVSDTKELNKETRSLILNALQSN